MGNKMMRNPIKLCRSNDLYILHDACADGDVDLVEDIVNNLPKNQRYIIDLPDPDGQSPLFHAIRAHKIAIAKYLLNNGARITHAIVFLTVRQANQYMLQLLAENGANFAIHTGPDKWTALHDAVCLHNNDVIEFLVNHGLDVNSRDGNGTTPLCIALSRKNKVAVRKLLNLNADINSACDSLNNFLPVHVAAEIGHFEYFELLIDKTDDLNKFTISQQTVLDMFISYMCFCSSHIPISGNSIDGANHFSSNSKGHQSLDNNSENLIFYYTKKIIERGGKLHRISRAYGRDCRLNIIQMLTIMSRYPISRLFIQTAAVDQNTNNESYFRYMIVQSICDTLQYELLQMNKTLNRRMTNIWLIFFELCVLLKYGPHGIDISREQLYISRLENLQQSSFSNGNSHKPKLFGKSLQYLNYVLQSDNKLPHFHGKRSLKDHCRKAIILYWSNEKNISLNKTFVNRISKISVSQHLKDCIVGLG
ncbi:hypothetical protein GJ496_004208 [Pomphorhynchus laevis]|nr:hypothetical protein GJ496_004208 [Pomphorhynchus laevis]